MTPAFINSTATAVPEFDIHGKFLQFCPLLLTDRREQALFKRMASRAQIEHRYSFLKPHADADKLDHQNFYTRDHFPDTQSRMNFYEAHAFILVKQALDKLDIDGTTHLILTTCTGFYAPGLDYQIVQHYGLSPAVERTVIGFMGCFAALNGLKLARHIVRSDNVARVLIVNVELCTLHMKPRGTLEEMLSFLIFADGCAASVVTSEPHGIELQSFGTTLLPQSEEQITWRIGELGFDMHLSGQVPLTIAANLPGQMEAILQGADPEEIRHWAIHPGGRTVLDAVKEGAGLEEEQIATARDVLRRFGNMSSATIMFVLHDMLDHGEAGMGRAMAFGPGLTVESMGFRIH